MTREDLLMELARLSLTHPWLSPKARLLIAANNLLKEHDPDGDEIGWMEYDMDDEYFVEHLWEYVVKRLEKS